MELVPGRICFKMRLDDKYFCQDAIDVYDENTEKLLRCVSGSISQLGGISVSG